jgi:hypothetical protein
MNGSLIADTLDQLERRWKPTGLIADLREDREERNLLDVRNTLLICEC